MIVGGRSDGCPCIAGGFVVAESGAGGDEADNLNHLGAANAVKHVVAAEGDPAHPESAERLANLPTAAFCQVVDRLTTESKRSSCAFRLASFTGRIVAAANNITAVLTTKRAG